jgi:hypothetical protein
MNISNKLFRNPLLNLLALAGLLSISAPADAHHAFSAEFDSTQPLEVKGVVTKFELVNPHSWLYLDVKGPDGKVTNWGFEFGAPYSLKEKGINKLTLKPGVEVTIKGFRAKSGKDFGYATLTVLSDGRTVGTGGAADAPKIPDAPKI